MSNRVLVDTKLLTDVYLLLLGLSKYNLDDKDSELVARISTQLNTKIESMERRREYAQQFNK